MSVVIEKCIQDKFFAFINEHVNSFLDKHYNNLIPNLIYFHATKSISHFIERMLEREITCNEVGDIVSQLIRCHWCEFLFYYHQGYRNFVLKKGNTYLSLDVKERDNKSVIYFKTIIKSKNFYAIKNSVVIDVEDI